MGRDADQTQRTIARIAHRQHGYITRQQLLGVGLSAQAIKRRVRIGWFIPAYTGVYAVGHLPTSMIDRAAAAVLACGSKALLSHGSAMCLWGWWRRWAVPFEVTNPSALRRKRICIHRSGTIARQDLQIHQGIRVTSPARTVLDIAPRLTERQLTRVVNVALFSQFLRVRDLAELLERRPHQAGAQRLRRFVEDPHEPTRSGNEDDFLVFAREYGLPKPRVNVRLGNRIVDALFEDQKVIVEIDDYGTHSSRTSFESDRDRDADHLELGYVTVRVTNERMRSAPAREARRLHTILARKR